MSEGEVEIKVIEVAKRDLETAIEKLNSASVTMGIHGYYWRTDIGRGFSEELEKDLKRRLKMGGTLTPSEYVSKVLWYARKMLREENYRAVSCSSLFYSSRRLAEKIFSQEFARQIESTKTFKEGEKEILEMHNYD